MQSYKLATHPNNTDTRKDSFLEFILTGRSTTIKRRVLAQLATVGFPMTAYELSAATGVYRWSLCHPLKDLVDKDWLIIDGTSYNPVTKRFVVRYAIAPDLFDSAFELIKRKDS